MQQVNSQNQNISMAAADSYTQNNMPAERVTNNKWTDIKTRIHTESRVAQIENGLNATRIMNVTNSSDTTLAPTTSNATIFLGQAICRQLKIVHILVFSGDKRAYRSWKAAFISCIDNAPATGEYKLLQLIQEVLAVIENLDHSSTTYEAAKERLESKYLGRRRQITIYLDELEQFRQVRPVHANELAKFADLLDIAIIRKSKGNGTISRA